MADARAASLTAHAGSSLTASGLPPLTDAMASAAAAEAAIAAASAAAESASWAASPVAAAEPEFSPGLLLLLWLAAELDEAGALTSKPPLATAPRTPAARSNAARGASLASAPWPLAPIPPAAAAAAAEAEAAATMEARLPRTRIQAGSISHRKSSCSSARFSWCAIEGGSASSQDMTMGLQPTAAASWTTTPHRLTAAGEACRNESVSKSMRMLGWSGSDSPVDKVRRRESSSTVLSDSIHHAATGPSRTSHCARPRDSARAVAAR